MNETTEITETLEQYLKTEEEMDNKILLLLKEERNKEAAIIEKYKPVYESITGKNFESALVDEVNMCEFNKWYEYDLWYKLDDIMGERERYFLRSVLQSSHTAFIFQVKEVLARKTTIRDILNWLTGPQKLIPRPSFNVT